MGYASLDDCILDLEKHNHLIRIPEEVDPYLEMAAFHLEVFKMQGPAILYENVKGTHYQACSNLFGTTERAKFMFRDTFETVQTLIRLKGNPMEALKHPFQYAKTGLKALNALPKKNPFQRPVLFQEIQISDLPLIQHWPKDGGAFITLPQVYSEDIDKPGIMNSNLGMYRIQLNGNDYVLNSEIGLHYQLHRGIGVHQTKANAKGEPLKVSIFIGGPPAHTLSAVMPLPEGISEMTFAGVLGNRRFRYLYEDGFAISTDADFVITGYVYPNENKLEGPFGDHLGYYSLQHDFPLMRVHKVYARYKAIWPFTVVGRPPQEDTAFGNLIHELTGDAIPAEIPGVKEVHAVDAAGVHPLLLAIGSERYTPYLSSKRPAELLTIANHILGTGQLSLAKFVFIAADPEGIISTHREIEFFQYIFERIVFERDLHFYTQTSIDTLDYSGDGLNTGSKLVVAAYGDKIRDLAEEIPICVEANQLIQHAALCFNGVLAIQISAYTGKETDSIQDLIQHLNSNSAQLSGIAQIVVCDDAKFCADSFANYVWVTYTRVNPSHDIHGVHAYTENKHWSCKGPIVFDARIKPHHAPELELDPTVQKRVEYLIDRYVV